MVAAANSKQSPAYELVKPEYDALNEQSKQLTAESNTRYSQFIALTKEVEDLKASLAETKKEAQEWHDKFRDLRDSIVYALGESL